MLFRSRFAAEIAAYEQTNKKGEVLRFDRDEHGRPETTVEKLRKLPKIFKKDGVIHAGAASGVCDGAGALIVATGALYQVGGFKWLWNKGGFEYPLFWALICLAITVKEWAPLVKRLLAPAPMPAE